MHGRGFTWVAYFSGLYNACHEFVGYSLQPLAAKTGTESALSLSLSLSLSMCPSLCLSVSLSLSLSEGDLLRPCWALMEPSRGLSGAILGPSWGHLGAILAPCWAPLGSVFSVKEKKRFWRHMLGPSRSPLGSILGPS